MNIKYIGELVIILLSPDELDCLWNLWSRWSSCKETCPYQVRNRTKVKGYEKPLFDGKECIGSEVEKHLNCSHYERCPNETGFFFMCLMVQSR